MPEETTWTTTDVDRDDAAATFGAAYVRELREEAAGHRRRAREAMERAERAECERDEARSALAADRTRRALDEAAARVGVDADLAARLAGDRLRLDDDGTSNAEAVLRELLDEHPSLRPTVARAGNPASQRRHGPVGEDDAARRARLYGVGGDPFANASARGGGVVMPDGPTAA